MPNAQLYILSAPKHSGKTTRLLKWIENKKNICGILSPVIDGRRFFMNAETKEIFPMEASPDELNVITIGKYKFSALSFNRANKILLEALNKKKGYLLIDEIGPLEISGNGFCDVLKKILAIQNNNLKIILVIREELVEEVIKYFGITEFKYF